MTTGRSRSNARGPTERAVPIRALPDGAADELRFPSTAPRPLRVGKLVGRRVRGARPTGNARGCTPPHHQDTSKTATDAERRDGPVLKPPRQRPPTHGKLSPPLLERGLTFSDNTRPAHETVHVALGCAAGRDTSRVDARRGRGNESTTAAVSSDLRHRRRAVRGLRRGDDLRSVILLDNPFPECYQRPVPYG